MLMSAAAAITNGVHSRKERERGQGLVEYAFILVLVALLLIVIVSVLGHQTNNVFSNVSNNLNK